MFLKRLTTPGVSDPITRVSRDPIRKIAPNERIMGPAFQCESYGLENRYLLQGVAYALKFKNPEDEQANELQNYIAEKGVTAAILKYTGIKAGSRMQPACLLFSKSIDSLAASGAILAANWSDAKMPVIDRLGEEFLNYVEDGMAAVYRFRKNIQIKL